MVLAAESHLITDCTPSWKSLYPMADKCGGDSWVFSPQLGTVLRFILLWELPMILAEASVQSASPFNVSLCPMLLLFPTPPSSTGFLLSPFQECLLPREPGLHHNKMDTVRFPLFPLGDRVSLSFIQLYSVDLRFKFSRQLLKVEDIC